MFQSSGIVAYCTYSPINHSKSITVLYEPYFYPARILKAFLPDAYKFTATCKAWRVWICHGIHGYCVSSDLDIYQSSHSVVIWNGMLCAWSHELHSGPWSMKQVFCTPSTFPVTTRIGEYEQDPTLERQCKALIIFRVAWIETARCQMQNARD